MKKDAKQLILEEAATTPKFMQISKEVEYTIESHERRIRELEETIINVAVRVTKLEEAKK